MEPLKYRGLSEAEVQESRRKNGENVLAPPVRLPWYRQYLKKFDDPVIRILMLAAILSCLIGDWIEGGGILAAVFLATFLAFLNEFRARQQFDALCGHSGSPFTLYVRVNRGLPDVWSVSPGFLCPVWRKP